MNVRNGYNGFGIIDILINLLDRKYWMHCIKSDDRLISLHVHNNLCMLAYLNLMNLSQPG